MARADWASSDAWDEAAQRDFDTRIKRARRRGGYYEAKARSLFFARPTSAEDPRRRAALALLERGLGDTQGDERLELLDALGRYHLLLGEREAAQARFRERLAERSIFVHSQTTEELLARCLVDAGDFAGAREVLAQRPRRRLDAAAILGAETTDATGAPYRDPEAAAEAIVVYYHAAEPPEPAVPEVMRSDRSSLEALDRHFRLMPRSARDAASLGLPAVNLERSYAPRRCFEPDFLARFAVELGAYVGRVMVKTTAGARWRSASPIAASRVLAGTRAIDPFSAVVDALEHELPLTAVLDFCLR